jgi:uncharacterized protein (TIGR03437 family)
MRPLALLLLLFPLALRAQDTSMPIFLGRPLAMTAPAVEGSGRWVVFGAGLAPDGTLSSTSDLYIAAVDGSGVRRLTQFASSGLAPQGVHSVSLTPDGWRAAFAALLGSGTDREQVHVLDIATGADRVVAIDTQGCIQPMLACANCFFTCVNTPHITADGGKVLYAVRRQNPFYVVNADGSGLKQLPVYSGSLAPSPQRAISRSGQVVFTSSAPAGPTFAASATDAYVMDLDGQNVRNVTNLKDPALWTQNATISADGTLIAFQSNMQPETQKPGSISHLWAVRPDGTGLRPLTFSVTCLSLLCGSGGETPSIAADGSLVAYLNPDLINGYHVQVVRTDTRGGAPPIWLRWSALSDAVLSDDGSRVLFTAGPQPGGRGAIYAANSDGTGLHLVYAPRAINLNGVVAAIDSSSPSPGSFISVYAFNLTDDRFAAAGAFPLPLELAGVSLLVNGGAVPLLAVTPWQLNAQLPQETPAGQAQFQVRFADGAVTPAGTAQVPAVSPAIFTIPYQQTTLAAAFNAATGALADEAHPLAAGDVLAIYGSGLGATNPLVPAGLPAPFSPLAVVVAPVEVLVGTAPAKVLFAGLTPGLAGLYQVNAIVPGGLKPGSYVLRWKAGGAQSTGSGAIWLK